MTERDFPNAIELTLPAGREYALVAGMAISGVGVLAGLDVDLIGDLRTVTTECMDCLAHQPSRAGRVAIEAWLDGARLHLRFRARERCPGDAAAPDLELTQGVLETLMPDVRLLSDEGGVWGIDCSMPA